MSETASATAAMIHQELQTNAALTDEIAADRIFDHVPRGTATPLLTAQITETGPLGASGKAMEYHTLTVNVWLAGKSRKPTDHILSLLKSALTGFRASDSGVRISNCRFEEARVALDVQEGLVQGQQTWRVISERI